MYMQVQKQTNRNYMTVTSIGECNFNSAESA